MHNPNSQMRRLGATRNTKTWTGKITRCNRLGAPVANGRKPSLSREVSKTAVEQSVSGFIAPKLLETRIASTAGPVKFIAHRVRFIEVLIVRRRQL